MEQRATSQPTRQSLGWIGQAVSGILLIVIVGLHMFFQHFQAQGLLSAGQAIEHLSSSAIFWLEILFVPVVTYHALLGVRAIIFDLRLTDATRRKISVGLTILGVLTTIYGVALAILIRAQPLT